MHTCVHMYVETRGKYEMSFAIDFQFIIQDRVSESGIHQLGNFIKVEANLRDSPFPCPQDALGQEHNIFPGFLLKCWGSKLSSMNGKSMASSIVTGQSFQISRFLNSK